MPARPARLLWSARLREALADGAVASLTGRPGGGVTTLLDATLAPLEPAGVVRLEARRGDAAVPLGLVAEVLGAGSIAGRSTDALARDLAVVLAGRPLAVDGAHEVDPSSAAVLLALRARADAPGLLLAGDAYGLGQQGGPLARLLDGAYGVLLEPLDVDEVRAAAALHRGVEPAQVPLTLARQLLVRSNGDPGLLDLALRRGPSAPLPLHVTRELALLDDAARAIARAAAVLRGRGDVVDLAIVADVEADAVPDRLPALREARLLDDGLRVRGSRVEALLAAADGPAEERRLVGRVARHWRERPDRRTDVLAALQRSDAVGEPWAEAMLLDAAEDARRHGDHERCLLLCERAEEEILGRRPGRRLTELRLTATAARAAERARG